MTPFFTLLALYAFVPALGAATLSVLGFRSANRAEAYAWALLAGLAAYGFVLFWLLLAPISLNFFVAALPLAVGAIGFGALLRIKGESAFVDSSMPRFALRDAIASLSTLKKWLLSIIAAVSVFKIVLAIAVLFGTPPFFDDAINNWNVRAKAIYTEGGLFFDRDDPARSFLGGNVPFYPFLTPIAKAGVAAVSGGFSEGALNSVHLVTLFAFCFLIFGFLMRRTKGDLFVSILLPFLFASLPIAFFHASSSYNDLLTGIFVALALALTVDWIESSREKMAPIVVAGLFLGAAAFTKNEGLVIGFFALSVAAVALAVRGFWNGDRGNENFRPLRILVPSAVAFLLLLPHTILRFVFGLRLNPNPDNTIAWHDGTIGHIVQVATTMGHDNIFWFAVPVVLWLWWPRKGEWSDSLRFAGIAVALLFGMMFFTFGFTANHQFLLDQTTINRTMMQLSAPLIVFLGLLISKKSSF